jgi:hypothetical protein
MTLVCFKIVLYGQGISVDRDENPRGVMSAAGVDPALSGGINFSFRPLPILSKNSLDFRCVKF